MTDMDSVFARIVEMVVFLGERGEVATVGFYHGWLNVERWWELGLIST